MMDSLPSGISLHELDADAFIAQLDTISRIYEEAKGEDAEQERMRRHSLSPGFRCITARHDSAVIGFIYGMYADEFHGFLFSGNSPSFGSHYYITVAIDVEMLPNSWADAFDIAEIHVRPAWQSKGIGSILIRTLCDTLSDGQVVLIVEVGNSRAHRLYQEIGFSDLPTPEGFPVHVMGASLPLMSPTMP